MTRDEFIDGYMERSELAREYRTADGFHIPGSQPKLALECKCGDDICEGWAMIPQDGASWHRFQNGLTDTLEPEIYE